MDVLNIPASPYRRWLFAQPFSPAYPTTRSLRTHLFEFSFCDPCVIVSLPTTRYSYCQHLILRRLD
uniref:Uncharacterized protein n=1 Tax=Ascaris lumbricoides TaxID=6252 RepID=A0A0M3ISC4_ASCLU